MSVLTLTFCLLETILFCTCLTEILIRGAQTFACHSIKKRCIESGIHTVLQHPQGTLVCSFLSFFYKTCLNLFNLVILMTRVIRLISYGILFEDKSFFKHSFDIMQVIFAGYVRWLKIGLNTVIWNFVDNLT